jgi:hypothetical protein
VPFGFGQRDQVAGGPRMIFELLCSIVIQKVGIPKTETSYVV